MIDRNILIEQCTEWAQKHLAENFDFRKYQMEAIVVILERVLNNVKTQVMNAPTGSGKSLIAMISAGVLWEYYQKKTYILVSDLSLFKQYEEDLKRYNLDWGHLKGKDNYICDFNSTIVSCGDCSVNMVSVSQLTNQAQADKLGYSCAKTCDYVQNRKKAQESPITIMTYQLYLIQRNYVPTITDGEEPFPERDLVICDEAHKIGDIVQMHYAPRISHSIPSYMKTLNEYAEKNDLRIPDNTLMLDIVNKIKTTDDFDQLRKLIDRYESILNQYVEINNIIRAEAKESGNTYAVKQYLLAGNMAREAHCKFDDFLELADIMGNHIIIKTSSDNETIINCPYEGSMITRYMHNVSGCELFMSATIGDLATYKEMLGLKNCKKDDYQCINIPSLFDYTKSPIYYSKVNPMSYKEKDKSIINICNQIKVICNKHINERGIIQTGNYENCTKLMNILPNDIKKRIILYNSSKEKQYAINEYLKNDNAILVGPTLLEGLNFDGDKCRFCICMKLPYASLANNLTKAKMKIMPEWYSADVIAKLEQGFGRGVRYNGDWCINYILDGCIDNLIKYSKHLLCENTLNRLKAL